MGSTRRRRTSRGPGRRRPAARGLLVLMLGLVAAASTPAAALPPLDPAARTAIAAADDDTDRLGEAVVVVLDAVRTRSGRPEASAADRSTPPEPLDVAAMLADPEAWRGRPVRVAGRLEQIAARPEAGADVVEWFIRTEGGPVAVLLVDPPRTSEGRRLTVDGWVIRRAEAIGRDGRRRSHPLVVAAAGPDPAAGDAGAATGGLLPLAALAAAATLLVVVRRMVVRPRRHAGDAAGDAARLAARRRARDRGPGPVAADAATLPPDAADALARLRRNSDEPAFDEPAFDEPASDEPAPRDESRP